MKHRKLFCAVGATVAIPTVVAVAIGLFYTVGLVSPMEPVDPNSRWEIVGIGVGTILFTALVLMVVGGLAAGWYALYEHCTKFWERRKP